MACFHPLLGVQTNILLDSGKYKIDIQRYNEDVIEVCKRTGTKYYEIPCGKCIGCRLEYSRQWANRMMMEAQYHDSNYFITLTYSDDFLPKNPVSDPDTGEYLRDTDTLRKKHLSKFMKHLRKKLPEQKLKFYGVGELGSRSLRPHYHIIVFGLVLDDLHLYKRTPQGDVLYTSDIINECWSNYYGRDSHGVSRYDQIGWAVVAPVTWETCAYTARYVTKKLSGPLEEWFIENNAEPPFSLMSRREGIGKKWYQEHPDWYEYDYINLQTPKKGLKFRPPRYFDKLLEQDIPEVYKTRKKEKEEMYLRNREVLLQSLEKPYLDYLADKEYNLKQRTKILKRDKV